MSIARDVTCVRYKRGELSSATVLVADTPFHIRFKTVETSRAKDGTLYITIYTGHKNKQSAVTGYKSPLIKAGGDRNYALLEQYFK